MRIGTTPTHYFELPKDVGEIKKIHITYHQNDRLVLEKYEKDCTVEGNVVKTKLTQEETFLFAPKSEVSVQIRVKTTGDDVLGSDVIRISCGECLTDEVL